MLNVPSTDADKPVILTCEQLCRKADLSRVAFATTRDLKTLPGLLGQGRAERAIHVGANVGGSGFNIFATGATGGRLFPMVKEILAGKGGPKPRFYDWVYVTDFGLTHQPKAIALPPGRAPSLKAALHKLIENLRVTLPALFESEDYQRRRSSIEASMRTKTQEALNKLGERAAARNVAIVRTPMGFTTAPMEKGAIVEPEAFDTWSDERKRAAQQAMREMEVQLEETMRAMPRLEKERRDAVRALDQETTRFAIDQEIGEARRELAYIPAALDHLNRVQGDLAENIQLFLQQEPGSAERRLPLLADALSERYDVNVLVTHSGDLNAAPVIEELHPTLSNLVGRVEHFQVQGALVTNFRMIKAGALHRANGGTILIDALSLLSEPYSWSALKRALVQRKIVIEDLAHIVGFASTASLEPEAIPLDVKVILCGERRLYYLLAQLDPEFAQHFKILADFNEEIDRSPENEALFAQMVGRLARDCGVRPLDRAAVELVIERAARLSDDSRKISLIAERVGDLVTEANHWAADGGRDVITATDIQRAIDEDIARASRLEEQLRESVLREISMIATDGERVGQVNGLSVIGLGAHSFGRPTRITARVRPGVGRIVDIEREVSLGGPLHSKGVLILSGFIAGRYALDTPMSLYASLVFEQSYGGIEGDSASAAELCALLSALADAPIRQDIGITGSVNQHGDIQAIGGVNEKIEGFFDVCKARTLTGRQGVVIPTANVQHLMLRADIIEACRQSRFKIFAASTIDQVMSLLSGQPAGQRAKGVYPKDTINRAVEDRLNEWARLRRKLAARLRE
jgi:lon-related putative ATP-dependent protease